MLKLTKKADYALIAVKHLAECGDPNSCSAKDIADAYGIPQAALAKILQKLVKSNLLVSHHGTKGGYELARTAEKISVLEVIKAIDGPLLMTSCGDSSHGCYQSIKCTVREPLRKVNERIQQVLSHLSIAEMREQPPETDEPAEKIGSDLVTLSTNQV